MKLASDEQDFQTWKERANLSVKNEEEKKKKRQKATEKGGCAQEGKWLCADFNDCSSSCLSRNGRCRNWHLPLKEKAVDRRTTKCALRDVSEHNECRIIES